MLTYKLHILQTYIKNVLHQNISNIIQEKSLSAQKKKSQLIHPQKSKLFWQETVFKVQRNVLHDSLSEKVCTHSHTLSTIMWNFILNKNDWTPQPPTADKFLLKALAFRQYQSCLTYCHYNSKLLVSKVCMQAILNKPFLFLQELHLEQEPGCKVCFCFFSGSFSSSGCCRLHSALDSEHWK